MMRGVNILISVTLGGGGDLQVEEEDKSSNQDLFVGTSISKVRGVESFSNCTKMDLRFKLEKLTLITRGILVPLEFPGPHQPAPEDDKVLILRIRDSRVIEISQGEIVIRELVRWDILQPEGYAFCACVSENDPTIVEGHVDDPLYHTKFEITFLSLEEARRFADEIHDILARRRAHRAHADQGVDLESGSSRSSSTS